MKTFVSAIALVIASPALAQTAPAQPQQDHGQHAQHQQHGQHGQHQQEGQHQQHGQHQGGEHAAHDCCADRNDNGRMDCCEQAAPAGNDGR